MTSPASLPYHEPTIITIIIQASLLLLLNILNHVLDKVVYCGLLGQVLLGVAWGTPGAKWLGVDAETVIVNLGYLGLLLLVYEGGLSTSLNSLKANLLRSSAVAVTGIGLPVGLSFVLGSLINATPLQCFAAGAALCSTSLGTTFTVLGTSGLTTSRLGVVLSSAAMMDDVVGLVMVQIISNLGQSNTSISATTVIRPLMVAIAFAVCAPLACLFIVKPLTHWLNNKRAKSPGAFLDKTLKRRECAFVLHTAILLGCIIGANYAGTSSLFAAYVAGASISWWDSEVPHLQKGEPESAAAATLRAQTAQTETEQEPQATEASGGPAQAQADSEPSNSGLDLYHRYYQQPVDRVLRPFFFASIGFSIPITQLFSGEIVWKGVIYTLLMILGKIACGIWLLRLPVPQSFPLKNQAQKLIKHRLNHFWGKKSTKSPATPSGAQRPSADIAMSPTPSTRSEPPETLANARSARPAATSQETHTDPAGSNPKSLYPASILGCAMTARGEIGFLISSVAESNNVFASESDTRSSSDIFLIVTWAIVLCTILGPLAVGLLVRRVKALQAGVEKEGRIVHRDVLGAWGV